MSETGFNLARFTIDIYSPEDPAYVSQYAWGDSDKRVLADLPAVMEHVSEKIAEILPVGYSVEIVEASL